MNPCQLLPQNPSKGRLLSTPELPLSIILIPARSLASKDPGPQQKPPPKVPAPRPPSASQRQLQISPSLPQPLFSSCWALAPAFLGPDIAGPPSTVSVGKTGWAGGSSLLFTVTKGRRQRKGTMTHVTGGSQALVWACPHHIGNTLFPVRYVFSF